MKELSNGQLVSYSRDNRITLWNLSTPYQCNITLTGHTRFIINVFELNDKQIISFAEDNTIRLWNESSSQCNGTLFGHTKNIVKSFHQMMDA